LSDRFSFESIGNLSLHSWEQFFHRVPVLLGSLDASSNFIKLANALSISWKITLVEGRNGAGKTSILEAIKAALIFNGSSSNTSNLISILSGLFFIFHPVIILDALVSFFKNIRALTFAFHKLGTSLSLLPVPLPSAKVGRVLGTHPSFDAQSGVGAGDLASRDLVRRLKVHRRSVLKLCCGWADVCFHVNHTSSCNTRGTLLQVLILRSVCILDDPKGFSDMRGMGRTQSTESRSCGRTLAVLASVFLNKRSPGAGSPA